MLVMSLWEERWIVSWCRYRKFPRGNADFTKTTVTAHAPKHMKRALSVTVRIGKILLLPVMGRMKLITVKYTRILPPE